ncbi:nuclear protein MDM1 isoform X2 [Xenopus laevis]|uniref:Nuclear protein MDM1 n=1 Tax=Xenopus laevis TaxID=8355 RepID=A0A8J0UU40_XENLA|nr:nuclear protein MDM1 isoform X2 [Xenopus laevis]
MPVQFKGLSEYDRNYTWKNTEDSGQEPTHSRWAGLRSDELGITKEPRFPSKRRVPYFTTQISKSFQWKQPSDNEYYKSESKTEEPAQLSLDLDRESVAEDKTHTPDAPRLSEKANSKSTASNKMFVNVGSTVKKTTVRVPEDNQETAAPSEKVNSQAKASGVHRVLKKKAGLSTVPIQHPLKISEYRRQFEKKTPTVNSPMLAAEQIIYNKNKSVPPFNVDALKRETEYNSQFKGSPPAKGLLLRKDWEEKHLPEYEPEDPSLKKKKRKQKKEAVCSPPKSDKSETEAKQRVHARKHKEKVIQQLKHSSKSCRRIKSEYSANFLSPSEYLYKEGAWVRAKKQMLDQDSHLPLGALWVAEIKELREKAEYYRHREQGTHFSRNHLNQILSVNNKFWDVSSNSSSEEQVSNNIKALDLAGFQTSSKNENMHKSFKEANEDLNTGNLGVSDVPTVPVRRRLVWDENNNSEPAQEIAALMVEDKNAEETDAEVVADAEEIEAHVFSEGVKRPDRLRKTTSNPSEDGPECVSLPSDDGGRLPTPKLKEFGFSQRTHHDLTTPARGGALLVSPMKEQSHTPEDKKKGFFVSSTPPKKAVCKKDLKTKLNKDKELTGPPSNSPHVAGIRTVDPLPLREDPWPIAHISNYPSPPKITVPVSISPEPRPYVSMSPHWNQSCRIQGALRDPEFQHNGNFGSPGLHRTAFSDDCSMEDDRLSQISERSAATSSLASQVLERAQRRKDDFWGKK